MKNLIALFIPLLLFAQTPQSENFTLMNNVIGAGGGTAISANFALVSAFGQSAPLGMQSGESFMLYAGFLHPALQVSPLSPIQRLVIKEALPDARLYWEPSNGAGSYSIYRAATIDFVPGPSSFIATVADTFYIDVGVLAGPASQQYYIVFVNNP